MDFTAVFVLGTVFGSGVLIVAIVMAVEYRKQVMKNRERLAAIEKGIPLADLSKVPPTPRSWAQRCLHRGIMLLFIGAGLAGALFVTAGPTVSVWGGFIAVIGLGNLACWLIGKQEEGGPG
jgi:hypothetical protein